MNIDSIFQKTPPSIQSTDQTTSLSKDPLLTDSISKGLEVLSLLSEGILKSTSPKFASIMDLLSQTSPDYKRCKLLFVEAYIQDFNEQERAFFLTRFLERFNSTKRVIRLETLDFETKDALWENIVRTFCKTYLDFPASAPTLMETFSLPLTSIEKAHFKETEESLEVRFDQGMDFLLDFVTKSPQPAEAKILFATYLARLITSLEELEFSFKTHENTDLSIQNLFEELTFYLLNLPYPSETKKNPSTLLSLMKEDLKRMDRKKLKEHFVEHLTKVLGHPSQATFLLFKEILSSMDFLDFNL